MNQNKFYHSVYLRSELCEGCIHCLKRCPTAAIRVTSGKASIIKEFCIDCGECIIHCPHNAKETRRDDYHFIRNQYDYLVALVDPSIYGQFNHLTDINIILSALIGMGFDDVFEVGLAYEYIMDKARDYIAEHPDIRPVINPTCPSVERLIRVRFPSLIENILPYVPPTEIAAQAALHIALEKSGLPEERIGIIYISPCPAQISFVHDPFGTDTQTVDKTIALKDIYPDLIAAMKDAAAHPLHLSRCGKIGITVGTTCSEAKSLGTRNYLAADGIENVIRVLNDIEDGKITEELVYAELKGCSAGCVGGVLNVENPYYARAKIKQLEERTAPSQSHRAFFEDRCGIHPEWTSPLLYEPVYRLGDDLFDSMQKMTDVEEILKTLPGLDCGSCGCPTCRTLAEDIVRGAPGAQRENCIYMLRGLYSRMIKEQKQAAAAAETPDTQKPPAADSADTGSSKD